MNIILIPKSWKHKRSVQISAAKASLWLVPSMAVMSGLLVWLGYAVGSGVQLSTVDKPVEAWVETLRKSQRAMAELRDEQRANIDALAVHIGNLQARLLRLDTLGERLAEQSDVHIADLAFDEKPAVGGAEQGVNSFELKELAAEIDRLTSLLDAREQSLLSIENQLSQRELVDAVTLSGSPTRQGWMSSGYGGRIDPFNGKKTFHRGVDFAGKEGVDIHAIAGGVVTRSELTHDFGNVIEIQHIDGYTSLYAHNEKNLVGLGDIITKGQVIAHLGSTGRSTGSHVHLEVHQNGKHINPSRFIRAP
jgi:murein DD-endopeptidase MepM/ murein hydrolase activator NlpD